MRSSVDDEFFDTNERQSLDTSFPFEYPEEMIAGSMNRAASHLITSNPIHTGKLSSPSRKIPSVHTDRINKLNVLLSFTKDLCECSGDHESGLMESVHEHVNLTLRFLSQQVEIQQQQSQLEELQQQNVDLVSQIETQGSKIEHLEEENARCITQAEQWDLEIEDLRQKNSQLTDANAESTTHFDQLTRENQDLQQRNAELLARAEYAEMVGGQWQEQAMEEQTRTEQMIKQVEEWSVRFAEMKLTADTNAENLEDVRNLSTMKEEELAKMRAEEERLSACISELKARAEYAETVASQWKEAHEAESVLLEEQRENTAREREYADQWESKCHDLRSKLDDALAELQEHGKVIEIGMLEADQSKRKITDEQRRTKEAMIESADWKTKYTHVKQNLKEVMDQSERQRKELDDSAKRLELLENLCETQAEASSKIASEVEIRRKNSILKGGKLAESASMHAQMERTLATLRREAADLKATLNGCLEKLYATEQRAEALEDRAHKAEEELLRARINLSDTCAIEDNPDLAFAATMALLKDQVVQLRSRPLMAVAKAAQSASNATAAAKMFREAHTLIKRIVVDVSKNDHVAAAVEGGQETRERYQWHLTKSMLNSLPGHQQRELMSQVRMLIVAFDNMLPEMQTALAPRTRLEIIVNRHWLLEMTQVEIGKVEKAAAQSTGR